MLYHFKQGLVVWKTVPPHFISGSGGSSTVILTHPHFIFISHFIRLCGPADLTCTGPRLLWIHADDTVAPSVWTKVTLLDHIWT